MDDRDELRPPTGVPRISNTVILRPVGSPGEPLGRPAAYPTMPAWRRPASRWQVRVAVVVLLGLAGLLLGWLAFQPHRDGWTGRDEGSAVAAAAALRYAGEGYDAAVRDGVGAFGTSGPSAPQQAQVDREFLDPALAPTVYPHAVLSLLAVPAVDRLGARGARVPGLVCGAAAVLVLMALGMRVAGRTALVTVPALVGLGAFAPEVMFGVHDESPLVLGAAVLLALLPVRGRRGWGHALAAAGLVPVLLLATPMPLLPVGVVLGGWLWVWAATRRARNAWLPFVTTVLPATAAAYAALLWWAPSDPLAVLRDGAAPGSATAWADRVPALWRATLGVDVPHLLSTDPWTVVVAVTALVGCAVAVRGPLPGVLAGAVLGGVGTGLLQGRPSGLRYLAPALPVLLLLAAVGLAWVARHAWAQARVLQLRVREARRPDADAPAGPGVLPGRDAAAGPAGPLPPADLRRRGQRRRHRDGAEPAPAPLLPRDPRPGRAGIAAAATWLAAAAAVGGVAVVHRPAPFAQGRAEPVAAATFPHPWPLTERAGTLICTGADYQVWFETSYGARYAVSGTAMAAYPGVRRVVDLAVARPPAGAAASRSGRPDLGALLAEGRRLCRARPS